MRLLAELHPVYAALEQALEGHPVEPFRTFCHPELRRAQRIQDDLTFLKGVPAGEGPGSSCWARILRAAETAPHRLLGHAYARYFGDLMGGRILRRAAQRALQLEDRGLRWLVFDIESPSAFIQGLRAAMDAAPFEAAALAEIEDEACHAFEVAIAIFEAAVTERGASRALASSPGQVGPGAAELGPPPLR